MKIDKHNTISYLCRVAALAMAFVATSCHPMAQNSQASAPNDFGAFNPLPAIANPAATVTHKHYTLQYSEPYEQPRWVAYMLTRDRANGQAKRTNNFREDPAVATGSATPNDYRRSGYTRGHLVPAGDMKWDTTAMSETFLMSNISPQIAEFNDGVWNRLESQVRRWARVYDTIYIVTGPLIDARNADRIGPNQVAVPYAFFKAIYAPAIDQTIAFIVDHRASDAPLAKFAVTVDSLEAVSGLDLFPALPDEQEARLEGTLCTKCWRGLKQ
ncbi:MAG: DNA/RNA non-specific endonuclease [Bacteroidales bacterium]|nr:DNA/RNA non-specific endonuclease [Bacteroidales bacterium]